MVFSQERIVSLKENATLKFRSRKNVPANALKRSAASILLPFIDDFSREGIYPQQDLWTDSFAFINNGFPDNQITIGVATLDGIDQEGNPYNPASGTSEIADHLTSVPVDLSPNANDTTVWLSFFYQPQGLGDAPESTDSLVVEFLDTAGTWIHQWSMPGREDTVFQRVNLRVNDPAFLHNSFRFRFLNYATVNGNRDHWNIDYVILRANTYENDSIRDNGFCRPQYSLLNEFQAMPYAHYKAISPSSAAMVPSISDSLRNINYGPTSFIYKATVTDESGTTLYSSFPSSLSANSNTVTAFTTNLNNFAFPSTPAKRAEFDVKNFVTITGAQSNLYNDTVSYRQVFDNYYAYDDGSAEIGYGITGNSGVKFAYKFDIKKADTLRAIDIYFNPTGVNVYTSLFQLAVWDQVTAPGFTDHLVYRQINQRPVNIDSINGFARYLFDTMIVVQPGPIWIGFIQNNPALLIGMGLDRNTDHHDNMYYAVDGYWYRSSIKGSWMMRPVFGDSIAPPIGVTELADALPFRLYPQPANDRLRLEGTADDLNGKIDFEIRSTNGALLKTGSSINKNLDVSDLPNGSYLLRLTGRNGKSSGAQSFLIQR